MPNRATSLATILVLVASPALAIAQPKPTPKCTAPNATVTASVTGYAVKKYHIASASQLVLEQSAPANGDCYWKYQFQAAPTHQDITLYLAPDRRYLTTTLLDTTLDPLAEEKAERERIAKSLTAIDSPSRGPRDAPVTIVEFSDFECPFCQRLANILEKEVLPTDPNVRVVFKNFPLPMHPWARPAAQLIACAGMQSDEAFWTLHDFAFASQHDLTAANVDEKLTTLAERQPTLDSHKFHDCIDRGLTIGLVMKDEELGKKLGVRATPTLYIDGTRVEGIRDAAQIKDLIAQARSGTLPANREPSPPSTVAVRAAPGGSTCDPLASRGQGR